MYPSLTIEDYPDNRTLGFDIIATNSFSTQFLNVTVENVNIEPEISPGFVLLIFLSILFFIYITLYVLIYLIQSTKEKEVVADRRSRSGEFSSKLKQIEGNFLHYNISTFSTKK